MLNNAELTKLDLKGLAEELEKARRNWLAAKLSVRMSQDKKSHLIKSNKNYVARILTRMNTLQQEAPQEESEEKPKK